MLISFKHSITETSRIMSDHISWHHGPAKLTHLINHLRQQKEPQDPARSVKPGPWKVKSPFSPHRKVEIRTSCKYSNQAGLAWDHVIRGESSWLLHWILSFACFLHHHPYHPSLGYSAVLQALSLVDQCPDLCLAKNNTLLWRSTRLFLNQVPYLWY